MRGKKPLILRAWTSKIDEINDSLFRYVCYLTGGGGQWSIFVDLLGMKV